MVLNRLRIPFPRADPKFEAHRFRFKEVVYNNELLKNRGMFAISVSLRGALLWVIVGHAPQHGNGVSSSLFLSARSNPRI